MVGNSNSVWLRRALKRPDEPDETGELSLASRFTEGADWKSAKNAQAMDAPAPLDPSWNEFSRYQVIGKNKGEGP